MPAIEKKDGLPVDTAKPSVVEATTQTGETKDVTQSNSSDEYWKSEAKKAFAEREALKAKLAEKESAEEALKKTQLEKNQEFETLWKQAEEKAKALDEALLREKEISKKWSAQLTKQVDEAKKILTAEQVKTVEEITADPEKQLEIITKLFPKSADGKQTDQRPTGGKTINEAQFESMSPRERSDFFANGGKIVV